MNKVTEANKEMKEIFHLLMDSCHANATAWNKKDESCGDHCRGTRRRLCDLLHKLDDRYLMDYNGVYELEDGLDVVDSMIVLYGIFNLLQRERL